MCSTPTAAHVNTWGNLLGCLLPLDFLGNGARSLTDFFVLLANLPLRHHIYIESNAIGGNSSSTDRWNDVPRGTMDEVRSRVRLDLPTTDGKAAH